MTRTLAVLVALLGLALLSGCGGPPAATIGKTSIDDYVALGDGFAAAPYTARTDRAKGCLRSEEDYPALLAKALKVEHFTDVSCAFARSQALTRSDHPVRGKDTSVPAQVDALGENTELVTLTIGLSDRDLLQDLLNVCVAQCTDQVTGAELVKDIVRIGDSVQDGVKAIKDRAPDARVWLVGYPQLLPDEGTCAAMPDLSQDQGRHDQRARGPAQPGHRAGRKKCGGELLDVAGLADGHDLCADQPWVGGARSDKGDPPKFHPLRPLADAISSALEDQLAT